MIFLIQIKKTPVPWGLSALLFAFYFFLPRIILSPANTINIVKIGPISGPTASKVEYVRTFSPLARALGKRIAKTSPIATKEKVNLLGVPKKYLQ